MERKFDEYLENINVSDVIKERVYLIYDEISFLYNKIEIDDMLITNVSNDGDIEYQSLWFFNKDYAIECKNFLNQDDFDIAPLNNKIIYFNIKKSNYQLLKRPKTNSVVFFTILVNDGKTSCNFTATGINCFYVTKVSRKYFLKTMDDNLYSEQ